MGEREKRESMGEREGAESMGEREEKERDGRAGGDGIDVREGWCGGREVIGQALLVPVSPQPRTPISTRAALPVRYSHLVRFARIFWIRAR